MRAAGYIDRLGRSKGPGSVHLSIDLFCLGRGKAVEHDAVFGLAGEVCLHQRQKGGYAVGVLGVVAKPYGKMDQGRISRRPLDPFSI